VHPRLATGTAILSAIVIAIANAVPAAAAAIPLPVTMVSAGDSITRAFDSDLTCFLTDCPHYSWSTGESVQSHYVRLLALNPLIAGHNYNLARTGAKMADLPMQLFIAGYYHVDYVTVLMGANDICTSSAAAMTPYDRFFVYAWYSLYYYFQQNPGGHVFVSSIPNIYQLWSTLHTNQNALNTWAAFKICQSMLANTNTEADRQAVVQQEAIDNALLQYACSLFPSCKFDNNAVFNVPFPASEVSAIDYFHPNIAGENHLASVTWNASFWSLGVARATALFTPAPDAATVESVHWSRDMNMVWDRLSHATLEAGNGPPAPPHE